MTSATANIMRKTPEGCSSGRVRASWGGCACQWVDLPLFGLLLACAPVCALPDLPEQVGLGPGGASLLERAALPQVLGLAQVQRLVTGRLGSVHVLRRVLRRPFTLFGHAQCEGLHLFGAWLLALGPLGLFEPPLQFVHEAGPRLHVVVVDGLGGPHAEPVGLVPVARDVGVFEPWHRPAQLLGLLSGHLFGVPQQPAALEDVPRPLASREAARATSMICLAASNSSVLWLLHHSSRFLTSALAPMSFPRIAAVWSALSASSWRRASPSK